MEKGLVLLEALAAKMGQTVETLWPFVVRRAYVGGLVDGVGGILGLVLLALALFGLRHIICKAVKSFKEEEVGPSMALSAMIGGIFWLLTAAITFGTTILPGFIRMLAPEGEALCWLLLNL